MTPGQLGEKGEIGSRLMTRGRDAHEPGERQRRRPHFPQECPEIRNSNASLLLLGADIDLDMDGRESAGLSPGPDQSGEQRRPVERVDVIE